jgi:hypothetical protein
MAKRSGHKGGDHDGGGDDYTVGYRKPPAHSRFKPGKSGNPKGRPKGRKNNATLVAEILSEKVNLNGPNGSRRGTLKEALIYKQVEQALKGDGRAVRTLLEIEEKEVRQRDAAPDVDRITEDDEAIFKLIVQRAKEQKEKP